MKKDPDHNSTDSEEIEALITRPERRQLHDGDAQLLARLLRLLLRFTTLLIRRVAGSEELLTPLDVAGGQVIADLVIDERP
jgi:hypothetical protein